jgi:hypothetical protein
MAFLLMPEDEEGEEGEQTLLQLDGNANEAAEEEEEEEEGEQKIGEMIFLPRHGQQKQPGIFLLE